MTAYTDIYSQNKALIEAFLERYRDENYILDHNSPRDHILYWAHLERHINIFSHGYNGLTKQGMKIRKQDHLNEAKDPQKRFHKKLAKHGEAVQWEVVEENLTEAEANALELFLRPRENIGWNTRPGGESINNINYIPNRDYVIKIFCNVPNKSNNYQKMKKYQNKELTKCVRKQINKIMGYKTKRNNKGEFVINIFCEMPTTSKNYIKMKNIHRYYGLNKSIKRKIDEIMNW